MWELDVLTHSSLSTVMCKNNQGCCRRYDHRRTLVQPRQDIFLFLMNPLRLGDSTWNPKCSGHLFRNHCDHSNTSEAAKWNSAMLCYYLHFYCSRYVGNYIALRKLHTQTFRTSFSVLCGEDASVKTHWYRNREGGSSRVGSSRQDVIAACVGRPGSFRPHTRGSASQAWRCVVEPVTATHISRGVEKPWDCAADTGFPYCNHHGLSIIKTTSYYAVRH